jgi:hypothetical protein
MSELLVLAQGTTRAGKQTLSFVLPVLRRSGRLAAEEPAFFFLNLTGGSGASMITIAIDKISKFKISRP